jgi:hypothetical protein
MADQDQAELNDNNQAESTSSSTPIKSTENKAELTATKPTSDVPDGNVTTTSENNDVKKQIEQAESTPSSTPIKSTNKKSKNKSGATSAKTTNDASDGNSATTSEANDVKKEFDLKSV